MGETSMKMATITLEQIATARSGDKGNHANIGVAAHTQAGFEFLRRELTAERVQEFFTTLGVERVERFELPKVWAFNFMLYNCLGGGASQSLRTDTQGKLLGTALLGMEFSEPGNLNQMLEIHLHRASE